MPDFTATAVAKYMAKKGELKVMAAERDEALIFNPIRGKEAKIIETYATKGDIGSNKSRERKGSEIVELWISACKSTNNVEPVTLARKILTILLETTRG
ncbi:MAG: hypothetical protein QQN63_13170 [Nitrosopumilus sp.]